MPEKRTDDKNIQKLHLICWMQIKNVPSGGIHITCFSLRLVLNTFFAQRDLWSLLPNGNPQECEPVTCRNNHQHRTSSLSHVRSCKHGPKGSVSAWILLYCYMLMLQIGLVPPIKNSPCMTMTARYYVIP